MGFVLHKYACNSKNWEPGTKEFGDSSSENGLDLSWLSGKSREISSNFRAIWEKEEKSRFGDWLNV